MFNKSHVLPAIAGASALVVSEFAFAGVNTTAALAEIADAKTAVLAIGAAVFGVAVGIKLYKWIRRAL